MQLLQAIVAQFLLFTAILTPLELLWPRRVQRVLRRGLGTDLLYVALAPFAITAGSALLLSVLGAGVRALVPADLRGSLAAQPMLVQLVEIFLIGELFAYGLHRASHRYDWLWRFHAVHHSIEEMDWIAAHRQHPLETLLTIGVMNLPALVLGFSTEPVLVFVLFQKLYTAFLHANVRIELRALSVVLATPRFHRWHHDADDRRGRNFASFLPVLDRIFGTYEVPDGEPRALGTGERVPERFVGQLWFPLRALAVVGVLLVATAAHAGPAWKPLQPGVELARFPLSDAANDGLTVVRVDPRRAQLKLGLATAHDKKPRTAPMWCHDLGFAVAINAGMFRDDHLSNVGYLVDGKHVNNARWNDKYKSVLALDPRDGSPPAAMLDLDDPADKAKLASYRTVVQNLRLIKRGAKGGENVWQSQGRKWSEAAVAVDGEGRVLFLFSRAPHTMSELNEKLLALPLGIQRAMHVEGGPEATLSIHADGIDEDHIGSFETGFLESDANIAAWELPNVLGVVRRK